MVEGMGHASALYAFVGYTLVVLGLAWAAHRLQRSRGFLSEYFLGSRGLGMIALALTFGATSASAGSFAGFPALIYAHGWVLALWIASYMVFPLCGMGLLGKRLNHVARRTGAITLPDIFRTRFGSPGLALLSTGLMAILLTVYLIPQFKLAALIMEQLLGSAPLYQEAALGLQSLTGSAFDGGEGPSYVLGLLLFAILVIVYTTLGGFRAVVWTDILQGCIMLVGVLVMLVLALAQVGGLPKAHRALADMVPPRLVEVMFQREAAEAEEGFFLRADHWFVVGPAGEERVFRTNEAVLFAPGAHASATVKAVEILTLQEKATVLRRLNEGGWATIPATWKMEVVEASAYAYGATSPGAYVTAPGPSPSSSSGFLPLGLAFSFFVFWALSGTGQPGNMIRLMAFDTPRTLRRAMASLSVYFTLIYLPLVVIFVCARILVPGLDQTPDRIMPVMAFTLTGAAGVPWLAGLIIAAPFAAAMSTVDSFMLMISSSVVRDVYQQQLRPGATERQLRRLSYLCTLGIGLLATVGALYPPQFLQYLIVFTGGGLAVAFLVPMALALYWPRFNKAGAFAALLGGTAAYILLYLIGLWQTGSMSPYLLMGLDPLIWGFVASLCIGAGTTFVTPPPTHEQLTPFFYD